MGDLLELWISVSYNVLWSHIIKIEVLFLKTTRVGGGETSQSEENPREWEVLSVTFQIHGDSLFCLWTVLRSSVSSLKNSVSDTSTKVSSKCIKDVNVIFSTGHIYEYLYCWLKCPKQISKEGNHKEKNVIDTPTWKSH